MDPKQKLEALAREAAELQKKAKSADFTEQDADRAEAIAKEHGEISALLARKEAATKALTGLAFSEAEHDSREDAPQAAKATGTLGERFTASEAFKAFKTANPNGIADGAPISLKAAGIGPRRYAGKAGLLTTGDTLKPSPTRLNDVEDLVYRPRRTLLDLITTGTTDSAFIQYRQIISKTNNAAIVPEATTSDPIDGETVTAEAGGLKPLSTIATQLASAQEYTYADGMEVTNHELADDGIIQTLIDSTLTENLDILIEDVLLNGSGTAGEPAGILNTTGVLQQAYATDMPTTIRKAITKLRTTSNAQIRGIVLNPEDNEAWDLLKDAEQRYYGNGPFGAGPGTAWGYERVESQAIPVGQALIGDFKTIHLLTYAALAIQAFNQHKDFAQRNLVYVRAELRAMQLIRNAAKLCIVDLSA